MCRASASVVLAAVAIVAATPAYAQDAGAPRRPSRQERDRRRILEQLGLDKAETTPKPQQPPPAAVPETAPDASPDASPSPSETKAPPPSTPFSGRVHETLLASCRGCHAAGGPAAATRFLLAGTPDADYAAARRFVDPAHAARSVLLTKATGVQHGGGATLAPGSDPYRRILRWISVGATLASRPGAGGEPPPAARAGAPSRRRPPAAPAADVPAPRPPEPPAEAPAVAAAPVPEPAPAPEPPAAKAELPATAVAVAAGLRRACLPCHAPGASAGLTRYVLSGSQKSDLAASRVFADIAQPAASVIVAKAAGKLHGGGAVWPDGGPDQAALIAWIQAGAASEPPPAPPATAAVPPAAAAVAAAPPPPSPPALAALPPSPTGIPAHAHSLSVSFLSQTLTLNGRFDLNLERRSFRTDPFGGGTTGFQNYHHFLFLSRTSTEDRLTFTAEIVSLEFYEIAARLGPRGAPWRANLRAGKLLVPFGADPLFHQSYGGHVGFDQRVLPAIWASEGVALTGTTRSRGLSLTGDLYAVKGHTLRRADGVVNLQNDFSLLDEARVAFGGRLGIAWGSLWSFYSAYVNPLGFDRLLFMQAFDAGLWRWRGIPALNRLVVSLGLLRADVSGGGSGEDYYHFASYFMARAYAFDWLYLQYRQGLRTFNNRRGVIGDATRWDSADGSTHNFALVARYHGLVAGIAYFLNFEKAGELDNDLFRVTVAYEF